MTRYSSYEVQMKRYLAGCCFAHKMECYWIAKEDGDYELADSLMSGALEIFTLIESLDGWRQVIEVGYTKTYTFTITGGAPVFPFFSGSLVLNGYDIYGSQVVYLQSGTLTDVLYALTNAGNSVVSSNDNNSYLTMSYNGSDKIIITTFCVSEDIDLQSGGFLLNITGSVTESETTEITGVSYPCLTNSDVSSILSALEKACGCSLNSVSDFSNVFQDNEFLEPTTALSCPSAYLLVNGASLGETGFIPSGGGLDLQVTRDGAPSGNWDGSEWVIPSCVNPSIELGIYSDSGFTNPITEANFNTTIYLRAENVSGITPVTYRFYAEDSSGEMVLIADDSVISASWQISLFGVLQVFVEASDDDENWIAFSVDFTSESAYLLDVYPNILDAWALNRLSAAYSGVKINILTTIDGLSHDIYLDGELVDTAAILTAAGGGDAFINIFYGENGYNWDQTNAANKFKIVEAGVLVTHNGLPAFKLDGGDNMNIPQLWTNYNNASWFVRGISNISTEQRLVAYNEDGGYSLMRINSSGDFSAYIYDGATQEITETTQDPTQDFLMSFFIEEGVDINGFVNNVPFTGNGTSIGTLQSVASLGRKVGSSRSGTVPFNGILQIVAVSNNNLIADRIGIEDNINTFWA